MYFDHSHGEIIIRSFSLPVQKGVIQKREFKKFQTYAFTLKFFCKIKSFGVKKSHIRKVQFFIQQNFMQAAYQHQQTKHIYNMCTQFAYQVYKSLVKILLPKTGIEDVTVIIRHKYNLKIDNFYDRTLTVTSYLQSTHAQCRHWPYGGQ